MYQHFAFHDFAKALEAPEGRETWGYGFHDLRSCQTSNFFTLLTLRPRPCLERKVPFKSMSPTFRIPRLCKCPWGPRGKGNLRLWLSWPQVMPINLAFLTLLTLRPRPCLKQRFALTQMYQHSAFQDFEKIPEARREGKPGVMTFMSWGHANQFSFSYTSILKTMTIFEKRGCL